MKSIVSTLFNPQFIAFETGITMFTTWWLTNGTDTLNFFLLLVALFYPRMFAMCDGFTIAE